MTIDAMPAGWYPDPSGAPGQMYWDGHGWQQSSTPAVAQRANAAGGQQPPNNYLVWAVFSFLGCFPLGLVAIINATKVSNLWALGSYDEARAASESAKKFALYATIAWAAVWGGTFLLFVVLPLLFGAAAVVGG